MATHVQAEKRNRQRIKRQAYNRYFKSTMRTQVKKVRAAIAGKNRKEADAALLDAVPMIARCAQKGVIPKQRASRYISRLTKAVSAI